MKYIEKINLNDQDFAFIPPAATAEQIGGIKAENATDGNVELKIDEQGKLYAPQYPDFSGKLDKNQGEDNADKVFVINTEGNLEPTEFKGSSDNRLIANVEKTENANINDSYQAKIENLKLYGKSAQGADPSPDNKQEITSVSQFDGVLTGKNLFDINKDFKIDLNSGTKRDNLITVENDILKINFLNANYHAHGAKFYCKKGKQLIFSCKAKYPSGAKVNVVFYDDIGGTQSTTTFSSNDILINITPKNNYIYIGFQSVGVVGVELYDIQLEVNDTATSYEPYQEQHVNYTPTNPMYSTLDGSISDYIDIENGKEVYNMKKYIVTGKETFFGDYASNKGYYCRYFTLNDGFGLDDVQILCNYLPWIRYVWVESKIGCSQNANNQIHLKFSNDTLGITDDTPIEEKRIAFTNYLKQLYEGENPLYVIYVVTPTEIPIDSEKLTTSKNLYSYTGTTNFLCNAPVSFNYEQSVDLVVKDLLSKVQTTGANLLYLNGK